MRNVRNRNIRIWGAGLDNDIKGGLGAGLMQVEFPLLLAGNSILHSFTYLSLMSTTLELMRTLLGLYIVKRYLITRLICVFFTL